jgi:hypothetical protein
MLPAIQTVIDTATLQDRDTPANIGFAVGAVTIVDRAVRPARPLGARRRSI